MGRFYSKSLAYRPSGIAEGPMNLLEHDMLSRIVAGLKGQTLGYFFAAFDELQRMRAGAYFKLGNIGLSDQVPVHIYIGNRRYR